MCDCDYVVLCCECVQTKKMAEAQKKRDEEAVLSRKQFIVHALTDAAMCRQKRETLMRQEIEDSQVMVMKAKQLIGRPIHDSPRGHVSTVNVF